MRGPAVAAVTLLVAAGVAACWSGREPMDAPGDGAPCAAALSPQTAGAVVILIQNFGFHPATVRVPSGTRVAWVNCGRTGDVAHTSTADGGSWASGLIEPGAVFVRTFDAPGTLAYHCEPHPFMTGSVIVE